MNILCPEFSKYDTTMLSGCYEYEILIIPRKLDEVPHTGKVLYLLVESSFLLGHCNVLQELKL